ncbi:MAG: 3-oxoacyl-[acyl-carrier protein] reductase [uncultured Arthrobacter sp.]|uniref:3-oxoacyl-[acyl-carrier protein] reductase n=1 Tax=uncultured Arthrobacter sp. TaxID=114050 RepID=A0A6J4I7M7_9MICC|nr:SDR family oxidoreductase [uncultured Arthrobacter sp.]CAA9244681.1 MAG: 3-oxoacyl-[acyl-carrier protein] reductase [uncultured Arthrobacter sp.]
MTPSAPPAVSTLSPSRASLGRLEGKRAVVTGSTSGIGEAIARALAAEGAHVLVSGRDTARGDTVVRLIRDAGGRSDFLAVDLAGSYDQIRRFAADAEALLEDRVDILVNNAGIYPATSTAGLEDADLDAMLAVNVRAPHVLAGSILPGMAARGGGSVINVGSWMAGVGTPYAGMYTATKAALEQLTRAWAAEFGPSGVRVNTLAPGATLTPGNEASREILDAITAGTPAGAVVRPDDIAYGAVFLASDEAGMMHGSTLSIDGGISFTRLG